MPTREELKARVGEAIDRRAEELIGIATHILSNPEPGFREEKTSEFVRRQFDALGLPYRHGLALTGVKAFARTTCPTVRDGDSGTTLTSPARRRSSTSASVRPSLAARVSTSIATDGTGSHGLAPDLL